MSSSVKEAIVPFADGSGRQHGSLRIVARSPESLFILTHAEAATRGEESVQILEGRSYEYSLNLLNSSDLSVRETPSIQPSQLSPGMGRIEPGLATGLMPIVLENRLQEEAARACIEVRSTKLDYHRDYRHMLDYIADFSMSLLMDIRAPTQARVTSSKSVPATTLHEQFAFLRHILANQEFHEAMHRILSTPHHQSNVVSSETDIRRSGRTGRALSTALSRGMRRVPVPQRHPIHQQMRSAGVANPSLPRTLRSNRSDLTRNTPENQFVKYALTDFLNVLIDIEERLKTSGTAADSRLRQEIRPLKDSIAGFLDADLFSEVGNAAVLPLASPVLQRKNGYSELLRAWVRFNLAAQLTWTGGEDVFGGGKKNVAILYEYWLFFFLLDIVSQELHIVLPRAQSLLAMSSDGFDVRLKAGISLSLTGTYSGNGRPIRVRFSYNRTFHGKPTNSGSSYPLPGSWTRPMRPDFTLSFWPDDITEELAERHEEIIHLHFDAKYRIECITGLFGAADDPDVDDDMQIVSNTTARPRRSDLLKMHAYRDAIRRTEGAYVLYPGPDSGHQAWTKYHEIIPGLGAFAVRPGHETAAKSALIEFFREVLDHVSTPHTAREHLRHHQRRAYQSRIQQD